MANFGNNSVRSTNGLFNKIRIRDLGKQVSAREVSASDRGELSESELLFVAGGRMAAKARTTCSGGCADDCGC